MWNAHNQNAGKIFVSHCHVLRIMQRKEKRQMIPCSRNTFQSLKSFLEKAERLTLHFFRFGFFFFGEGARRNFFFKS